MQSKILVFWIERVGGASAVQMEVEARRARKANVRFETGMGVLRRMIGRQLLS